MSKKIKVEFTQEQWMSVNQTVYHDINDMQSEADNGVPQGMELRILKNAYGAMLKGLEEWKEGK